MIPEMTVREQELFDSLDLHERTHPLVRDDNGVLRFEQWLFPDDRKKAIQEKWDLRAHARISKVEFWTFYRSIGYSLSGYCELKGNE